MKIGFESKPVYGDNDNIKNKNKNIGGQYDYKFL